MNTLEYIDKQILFVKQNIDFQMQIAFESQENKFKKRYHENEALKLTEKLQMLEQIKAELEAWEVMNEEFIIKPYYQQGKYPAIMVRHPIEDDEFVRRGVKQEKYDKVLKALGVKE